MTLEVSPKVAPNLAPKTSPQKSSFRTAHDIAKLSSGGRPYVDFSDESITGLLLRVSKNGNKTYRYRYQLKGKSRILTIGPHSEVSLQDARAKATQARAQVLRGEDPAAEAQRARAVARSTPTVEEFIDEYLERHAKVHKSERAWKEDERQLRREVIPQIGRLRMDRINKRDVVAIIDRIRDRGANTQANRVTAVIRKMFNFAVARGVIPHSPITGISLTKEQSRKLVLNDDQIRYLWSVTEIPDDESQGGRHPSILRVLRVLLLTGLRIEEATGAPKSEIDLEKGVWVIPGEDHDGPEYRRTKNKVTHTLPLSPLALAIIKESITMSDELSNDWVFPGLVEGGHITKDAVEHAMRALVGDGTGGERLVSKKGVATGPTPHDLRRTFATRIGSLGFNRLVQDKLLNHVDNSVGAIYDRYDYEKEKREAMIAWEAKLLEILKAQECTASSCTLETGVSEAA